MANEHNTRWQMSIMLDSKVVYGSFFRQVIISYHRRRHRPPQPRPHRLAGVTYTLLYRQRKPIWRDGFGRMTEVTCRFGQTTEWNLAKWPNESWPNDRTIRENGERRYPRMKKLRTILPSAGIAMILFMTVGIDTNYINNHLRFLMQGRGEALKAGLTPTIGISANRV